MKHFTTLIAIIACVLACNGFTAQAQQMQDRSYSTVGYIRSDGTVQDRSYTTIGHIRSDGTVQDRSYTTIGHANGVSKEWAAVFFFFFFK